MNLDDDDDSEFEQALRADLPSRAQQNRMRQRLLAAGLAAGTALGSTNVAATQAGFAASALSKLSGLSWPAKLGLTALLAAPVVALPVVYAPVPGAEMVSQVQRSTSAVRARSVPKPVSAAQLLPRAAGQAEPAAPEPVLEPESQPNLAARAPAANAGGLPPSAALGSAALAPSPSASEVESGSEPAVAAFDSTARGPSTLAAETRLLDRAFAALAAGDRSTAAALVAEHTRRFPDGLLRQERERARARIALDQKGE
ncbi:MAG TPA: hypothetical protein VFK05_14720 [Polyangiaceae bacterium]|nr:hypothetical protein [Polyangiaceae bacterium]